MDTPSPSPSSPTPSSFGVPVAIVIAGGLIALAIYFGGGSGVPVPLPTAVVTEPAAVPLPTIGNFRPVSEADHTRGPASARVTVIEYSDLECPFCKRFHPTMQRLIQEYPNDVRWVYRHYPIEQLHQQAEEESIAVECAAEQGKFWELLDKIYEVTPSNDGLDLATLPQLAQQVGVANVTQFETCLTSDKYKEKIAQDLSDAQVAGGRGTPYSVVIGPNDFLAPINGAQPYEQVKAIIDQALSS